MAITAAMVKELREMTGAGMMDCKKALANTDGDMDKAVEYLRENGMAKAAKKAGRIAAEGIVKTVVEGRNALVISVGITTIGSFVGAGGVGDVILRGIAITDGGPIIVVGAVLCAFIAIMMDWLFDWIMK